MLVYAFSDMEIENSLKSNPDAAALLPKNSFKQATVVMPKLKTPISLGMDRRVVERFKAYGRRYQSRLNAVLKA